MGQVVGRSFGLLHPTRGGMHTMQNRSVASIAMRRGGLTEAEKPLVVDLASRPWKSYYAWRKLINIYGRLLIATTKSC
jgi:hypothetical protein